LKTEFEESTKSVVKIEDEIAIINLKNKKDRIGITSNRFQIESKKGEKRLEKDFNNFCKILNKNEKLIPKHKGKLVNIEYTKENYELNIEEFNKIHNYLNDSFNEVNIVGITFSIKEKNKEEYCGFLKLFPVMYLYFIFL
ncbi:MAG: hypothetical protein ACOCP4_06890, partial [Candidatus Woesearchaeota archaeon]